MNAVEVLVPLALGVVVNEAVDISPWLARKLVRWSARRIADASMAARYEEEWLAGLDGRPGKLLQLFSAISIVVGASWRMRDIFRAVDSGDTARRRRRWPRPHMRLAFPSGLGTLQQYWGYVTAPVAVATWVTGQGSWVVPVTLSAASVVYFAFQVPTYCGAASRDGSPCRNNARGLLLGCHLHQHRWAWLRRLRRPIR